MVWICGGQEGFFSDQMRSAQASAAACLLARIILDGHLFPPCSLGDTVDLMTSRHDVHCSQPPCKCEIYEPKKLKTMTCLGYNVC